MRVNKSCIVGCEHVETFKGDYIKMDQEGEVFQVSRRRKKEISQQYTQYCKRMARYGI